jgi:outer membrane protein TolC
LRAEARVEAAKANLNLSETLLKLAQNQKAAGTATGIDVTRARVQLANDQQRLLVAENDRTQSHLHLLRAMDLRLETRVQLTDRLEFKPAGDSSVEKALAVARQSRSDWKAQIQREDGARLNYSATKLERLPSLAGFADYGSIGTGFDNLRATRTIGFNVKVPIFDGGRRDARRTESLSQFRQEQIRKTDLERHIELEIRLALDNLHSAEEQFKVAEDGLTLSGQEMEQARRRFENGIVSSVEVTEAQTRMERARDNRIAALFLYNQARIDLLQAMGTIRTALD